MPWTTGNVQEGNQSAKEHYSVLISYELVKEMSLLMFQTNGEQAGANLPDQSGGNGSTHTTFFFFTAHSVPETHVHAWPSSKICANRFLSSTGQETEAKSSNKKQNKKTRLFTRNQNKSEATHFIEVRGFVFEVGSKSVKQLGELHVVIVSLCK